MPFAQLHYPFEDLLILRPSFPAKVPVVITFLKALNFCQDFALTDKDVSDVNRKLAMIWNVYDFFITYASVDGWESPVDSRWCGELKNPLDINSATIPPPKTA